MNSNFSNLIDWIYNKVDTNSESLDSFWNGIPGILKKSLLKWAKYSHSFLDETSAKGSSPQVISLNFYSQVSHRWQKEIPTYVHKKNFFEWNSKLISYFKAIKEISFSITDYIFLDLPFKSIISVLYSPKFQEPTIRVFNYKNFLSKMGNYSEEYPDIIYIEYPSKNKVFDHRNNSIDEDLESRFYHGFGPFVHGEKCTNVKINNRQIEANIQKYKRKFALEFPYTFPNEEHLNQLLKILAIQEFVFYSDVPLLFFYLPSNVIFTCNEKMKKVYEGSGGMIIIFSLNPKNAAESFQENFKFIIENLIYTRLFFINPLYSKLNSMERLLKLKEVSFQTAASSIMSRNMSHNIGSHILSSLGREGINAADDRILFQYLQHRMDYIAQISTEMPTWSSPVWFISDLMKRFYMQTHLLEYIGKSEGLGAKYWSTSAKKNQEQDKNKIVIKIKDAKCLKKYIISDKDELSQNLDDFQLAIPGGIVGLQAFYTILENIIRNSAKHNWKKDSPGNPENLEITIELENNPNEEFVAFKIYDNVSDDSGKCEIEENNGKCKQEKKRLHEKMNDIFSTDFIDESGKLKKENWGLAEMRISAGYLNQKSYQEIGFHKDRSIIEAVQNDDNGKKRLAYKFKVPKPKDLLIIGDPTLTDLKKEDVKILKTSGIYIENRIDDKPYEHEIVVIFEKALNGDYKTLETMPGRVIIVKQNKESNDLIAAAISKGLGIEKKIVERKIVILDQLKKDIKNGLTSNTNDGRKKREDIKIELYQTWVSNLINSKEFFYLDLKGRSDPVISDYLEEQMYQLIKNHVEKSEFLKKECKINDESDLKKLREIFQNMNSEGIKNFLSIHALSNQIKSNLKIDTQNKIQTIGRKLENMEKILKDFIFRNDDNIDTVPKQLISKTEKENINNWEVVSDILFPPTSTECRLQKVNEKEEHKATILYKRHFSIAENRQKKDNKDDKNVYKESLSGSQFYFTMLYDSLTSREENILIKSRQKKIILQLIENALLKCVIIDERVARFLSTSDVLQKKFKLLRIQVPFHIHMGGKKEVLLTEKSNGNTKTFSDENLVGCDIFIIHQGVLDKMGLSDPQKAGKFLEGIKQSVPFVFITSGRGKPDNVADNVKFLPFSSIDSFLLKEYPEKLLLIQSAIRLNLPKKGESA